MMRSGILFIGLMMILAACAKKVGTSTSKTTTGTNKYSEDLSVWRPKGTATTTDTTRRNPANDNQTGTTNTSGKTQYVEAKFAVNESLDAVLDSISRINKSIGFVDGYTIQVYSGIKREDALNAKKQLTISLPDVNSEVQFVQPNYRVRAGKYYDRFDAHKDYMAIKKYFPNAILLPERIPINN